MYPKLRALTIINKHCLLNIHRHYYHLEMLSTSQLLMSHFSHDQYYSSIRFGKKPFMICALSLTLEQYRTFSVMSAA